MKVNKCGLSDVLILEPKIYSDDRGSFKETYNRKLYAKYGINLDMVQDNFSVSSAGVLRGLHFQKTRPQGKLVWCSYGEVYDVIVDIKPSSPTYKKYIGIYLSDRNNIQIWIPPGYAHGFCVTSPYACFQYKCTEFYEPSDEAGIRWNDTTLDIKWPDQHPKIISNKDQNLPFLEEI
jgi:dTDP-4-dehydrorhamnose 3,5-epimerase